MLAFALVAATGVLIRFFPLEDFGGAATTATWLALGAGVSLLFARRPARFAVAVAALLLFGALAPDPNGIVIARERDFFGPKRVFTDPAGRYHFLLSAGTVHGLQALDPARASEPLGYYAQSGPLGDVFRAARERLAGRAVAVVGLGIGAAACYGAERESWTFYEIDPAVVALARDPRLFSQLGACGPGARIVLGDARLSLARETAPQYALIVLDAYDGDHVPVHLLVREAVRTFLSRLAGDGMLAFHISNRRFDLEPVLAALADDAGLDAVVRRDAAVSDARLNAGVMASTWVAMARKARLPPALANDPRWGPLAHDPSLPLWTDDYSSLARVLWR